MLHAVGIDLLAAGTGEEILPSRAVGIGLGPYAAERVVAVGHEGAGRRRIEYLGQLPRQVISVGRHIAQYVGEPGQVAG